MYLVLNSDSPFQSVKQKEHSKTGILFIRPYDYRYTKSIGTASAAAAAF